MYFKQDAILNHFIIMKLFISDLLGTEYVNHFFSVLFSENVGLFIKIFLGIFSDFFFLFFLFLFYFFIIIFLHVFKLSLSFQFEISFELIKYSYFDWLLL